MTQTEKKHRCGEHKITPLKTTLRNRFEELVSNEENSYTYLDILKLIDFYLFHPLNEDKYAQLILRDIFHWRNTRKNKDGTETWVLYTDSMFQQMLSLSGLKDNITYTFTDNATKKALRDMDLAESYMCALHPRAVLNMNSQPKIVEDNDGNLTVETSNTEAGYRCIFRHIRNAFAHNNVFFFENGNILLKDYQRKDDKQDEKKVTVAILIKFDTLFEWIKMIETDQETIKG